MFAEHATALKNVTNVGFMEFVRFAAVAAKIFVKIAHTETPPLLKDIALIVLRKYVLAASGLNAYVNIAINAELLQNYNANAPKNIFVQAANY